MSCSAFYAANQKNKIPDIPEVQNTWNRLNIAAEVTWLIPGICTLNGNKQNLSVGRF